MDRGVEKVPDPQVGMYGFVVLPPHRGECDMDDLN